MRLTAAAYIVFMDAIAAATGLDELAPIRKEVRLIDAGDERVKYLEQLIDARAARLTDANGDSEDSREWSIPASRCFGAPSKDDACSGVRALPANAAVGEDRSVDRSGSLLRATCHRLIRSATPQSRLVRARHGIGRGHFGVGAV